MATPKKHYVDNQQFTALVAAWVLAVRAADAVGDARPCIPEDVGVALLKIATGVVRKSFRAHPMREDLASHAVLTTLEVLDKFDVEKSVSGFAWVSTTMHRACLRVLAIEDTTHYHALCYAREYHASDRTVRSVLTDSAETIERHEQRLATIREKRKVERAAKPKTPKAKTPKPKKPRTAPEDRKVQRYSLTLPDGEVITPFALATRLGTSHTMIYRRLRAGCSVEEILAEFTRV